MTAPKFLVSTCAVCGRTFDAPRHIRAYANLCTNCWSSSILREWDRLDSARALLAPGRPDSLTLSEWLATTAAYHGRCAVCLQIPFARLTLLVPDQGLTAHNAIPVCKACEYFLKYGFTQALERVAAQMALVEEEVL